MHLRFYVMDTSLTNFFLQVDISHPLTVLSPTWMNCPDQVNITCRVQPVLHNGDVYTQGSFVNENKCVPWKYSTLVKSWSPLPSPTGVELDYYALSTYDSKLVLIGGQVLVSTNRFITVYMLDEGNSWIESTTIPNLPLENSGNILSAASQEKYLIIAWRSDRVRLLLFDGSKWKEVEEPQQKHNIWNLDVIIKDQRVYLLVHQNQNCCHLYCASVESLLGKVNDPWKLLKSLSGCETSNLTLFAGYLTIVAKRPFSVLILAPRRNNWISLCDLSREICKTTYVIEMPSIIGLSSGKLLLMGRIKLGADRRLLGTCSFDVLEVSVTGMYVISIIFRYECIVIIN